MKDTPLTVFVVLISLSSSCIEEVLDSLHRAKETALARGKELLAEWPNAEVLVEEHPIL